MSYIKRELHRLLDILENTDPRSDEYIRVMRALDLLASDGFEEIMRRADRAEQPLVDNDYAIPDEVFTDNAVEIAQREEITEPDVETDELPKDVAEVTHTDVNSNYTEDDIKEALFKLRRDKNVNISELIRNNFGVAGWKALPAERYGELMELIAQLEKA